MPWPPPLTIVHICWIEPIASGPDIRKPFPFMSSLQANETTIVFTFVFTISLPRSTIPRCFNRSMSTNDPSARFVSMDRARPDVPSWRRNLNPRLNSTWKSRIVFLFRTRSTKSLLYLLELFVTWYYWRRRSWFGISYLV